MRRVLSREAETKIKLPLGVKLRSLTTSWWPERFKSRSPGRGERHSVSGSGDTQTAHLSTPQTTGSLTGQAMKCLSGPCGSQERPTCLHLPNLDLSIIEPCGKDQARDVWHLGMVARPELPAGWRRPRAEGQTPNNLTTVQCLLLWAPSSFCIIFAASAFGFEPFRNAGKSKD